MRRQIERNIIVLVLIMCIWSVIAVFSTTVNSPVFSNIYLKQIIAVIIGFILMLIMRIFSYKILDELSFGFFIITVLMLLMVLFFGVEIHGGRRWLNLGVFYFQPVEFAKITLILITARIIRKSSNFLFSIIPLGILFILVTSQPDFGSVIPMFAAVLAMLAISEIDTRWMNIVIVTLIIAGAALLGESYMYAMNNTLLSPGYLVWPVLITVVISLLFREARQLNKTLRWKSFILTGLFIWTAAGAGLLGTYSLKGYQKRRIVAFLMPELDPLGAGYNTRQSILAIGSGRLTGRGLFAGTQTQLGFLPVRHTDFIFASIAEELGFIGGCILLCIIFAFLWQFIKIINRSEDYTGRLMAAGIFTLFISQTAMNIGVTLGMLPVMGLQLPIISYGGTGMVAFLMMTGVMLNINRGRDIIAT